MITIAEQHRKLSNEYKAGIISYNEFMDSIVVLLDKLHKENMLQSILMDDLQEQIKNKQTKEQPLHNFCKN